MRCTLSQARSEESRKAYRMEMLKVDKLALPAELNQSKRSRIRWVQKSLEIEPPSTYLITSLFIIEAVVFTPRMRITTQKGSLPAHQDYGGKSA